MAVRRLAKFVDTELHQGVSVASAVAVTSTGLFVTLAAIPQGDDDMDRNGSQVSMRRLEIRFIAARGLQESCLRIIILVDKQTNGVVPTLAQVLTVTATGEQTVTSPINNDNKKRFTILSDRMRTLNAASKPTQCWSQRLKLTHKMRFDGVGIGTADIVSGALWLLLISNTVGGGNSPVFTTVSRVWFAP